MADVMMKQSDLSGKTGGKDMFGRLVVKGHPAADGARVLDVLPDEVTGLKPVDDLIELEYTEPGADSAKTLVVRRADFDKLVPDMAKVLQKAAQRPGRRASRQA